MPLLNFPNPSGYRSTQTNCQPFLLLQGRSETSKVSPFKYFTQRTSVLSIEIQDAKCSGFKAIANACEGSKRFFLLLLTTIRSAGNAILASSLHLAADTIVLFPTSDNFCQSETLIMKKTSSTQFGSFNSFPICSFCFCVLSCSVVFFFKQCQKMPFSRHFMRKNTHTF